MNSILLRLSDKQMDELDFIVNTENKTRTEVIRAAIEAYVLRKKSDVKNNTTKSAFGLWKERAIDGLEYQQRMRSEW